jgi:hypothetical protein
LHLKWKNLFAEVRIGGNLNTRGKTSKRNLFPIDLQNLMPRLGVCDPSGCRVAFISRDQLQEVASVASDASNKCSPVVALSTKETQQAVDGDNQRDRWPTYVRSTAGLIGESLETKQPGSKSPHSAYVFFLTGGFRASRPLIQAIFFF